LHIPFDLYVDRANATHLEAVESSLFALCLDEAPQNESDPARTNKSRLKQMLTGNGPNYSGANRWFDKTVQVSGR
jgi:hypothetical protein